VRVTIPEDVVDRLHHRWYWALGTSNVTFEDFVGFVIRQVGEDTIDDLVAALCLQQRPAVEPCAAS